MPRDEYVLGLCPLFGKITSIEQQNDGHTNTKQVVGRYDLMGRQIENDTVYSGVLILVFTDGTRQKVFEQ